MNAEQEALGALLPKRLNGNESFHDGAIQTTYSVNSFWSWAYSSLAANNLRGHLAEYIVASALGVADDSQRIEWDDYDLMAFGLKIEVKSAAYLQQWNQDRLSSIIFNIAPSYREEKPRRIADVYVFCVLTPKDKRELDPLNLAQWDFYVLPTRILETLGPQKTITLSALRELKPHECHHVELKETIQNSK